MANKIYVMKDDSDKLKQAVVTHGAIQASVSGDTIYIGTADATPKSGANLTLSPTKISLPCLSLIPEPSQPRWVTISPESNLMLRLGICKGRLIVSPHFFLKSGIFFTKLESVPNS